MPELQIGEQPQPIAMLVDTCPVILCEPPERGRLEEPSIEGARGEDQFLDERPGRAPQPAADGDREAHLATPEDLSRHDVPHRLSQHGLRPPPPDLEAGRHRRDVLDEIVIEEGHAALD